MKLEQVKYVYLIGIGGIGMSGLARYFKSLGKQVSGYDKIPSSLTDEMQAEGINIHFEEDINKISNEVKNNPSDANTLIIYTPAVPAEHKELRYFKENAFNVHKRAEILGQITQGHFTVAVAGSHGKTTTATLISHILKSAQINSMAFLGGVSKNYNSNVLQATNPTTAIAVAEADEYDKSFLTLSPDIAVITSIDPDHLDIYGDSAHIQNSYSAFANLLNKGGCLITKQKVKRALTYNGETYTYSLNTKADYYACNITIKENKYVYDVVTPKGEIKSVQLGVPGMHNIENSVAAMAVVQRMNVNEESIRKALGTFKGVKRRFDYQITLPNLVFIDDYAHHPAELAACINSVKALYPDKKITGIFQPHLYSRTRDFADDFATSLNLLDRVILLDIYPAREAPIKGIDSAMLLSKVKNKDKQLCSKQELTDTVTRSMPQVLLTMGAGDIDRLVEPLKAALLKKINHA